MDLVYTPSSYSFIFFVIVANKIAHSRPTINCVWLCEWVVSTLASRGCGSKEKPEGVIWSASEREGEKSVHLFDDKICNGFPPAADCLARLLLSIKLQRWHRLTRQRSVVSATISLNMQIFSDLIQFYKIHGHTLTRTCDVSVSKLRCCCSRQQWHMQNVHFVLKQFDNELICWLDSKCCDWFSSFIAVIFFCF